MNPPEKMAHEKFSADLRQAASRSQEAADARWRAERRREEKVAASYGRSDYDSRPSRSGRLSEEQRKAHNRSALLNLASVVFGIAFILMPLYAFSVAEIIIPPLILGGAVIGTVYAAVKRMA